MSLRIGGGRYGRRTGTLAGVSDAPGVPDVGADGVRRALRALIPRRPMGVRRAMETMARTVWTALKPKSWAGSARMFQMRVTQTYQVQAAAPTRSHA